MGEGSHLVICDALAAGRGCTRVRVIAHADELGRCVDVNAVGTLELVAVAEADAAVDLLVRRNRVFEEGGFRGGVARLGDEDREDRWPSCVIE